MAPMKRPAAATLEQASARKAKRTSLRLGSMFERAKAKARAEKEDDEEVAENPVMKKPAGILMKRPAAAGEDDGNEVVMKRPAAAVEDEGNEEEAGDEQPDSQEGLSEAQIANAAVSAVRKQQRFIDKILADNEKLAQRIKGNKSELRQAEKQMETLKDTAKKHTRKLGAKKSAFLRKKMEGKMNRAKAKGERAAEALKKTQKHINKIRKGVNAVKDKADTAEAAYKKAQKAYEEAKKHCKQLKEQGEDVPDEGEKDLSAPGAYKPPGVRAAKERDTLKASLSKLKATWEKAHSIASVKLERMGSFKEKASTIKQQIEEAEQEEASIKKRPAAK